MVEWRVFVAVAPGFIIAHSPLCCHALLDILVLSLREDSIR